VLTSILTQLTGVLDKRFTLNALFPALAFSLGVLLVGYAGGPGIASGINAWNAQDGVAQAGMVVVAIAAVFLLALFLASQALAILHLYEGYVGPMQLLNAGTRWHEQRFDAGKNDPRRFDELTTLYPLPLSDGRLRHGFLPTRLGNILRSGERYPNHRYGLDGVVGFSRLLELLPESVVAALSSARAQLELTLTLSLLSAVFGVYSGIYLAISEIAPPVVIACSAGGAIAAWGLYRASLGFAIAYSSQIKSAFDMHRLELLDALKVPSPANRNEERRRWDAVGRLLYRNDDQAIWWYTSASAKVPKSIEPKAAADT